MWTRHWNTSSRFGLLSSSHYSEYNFNDNYADTLFGNRSTLMPDPDWTPWMHLSCSNSSRSHQPPTARPVWLLPTPPRSHGDSVSSNVWKSSTSRLIVKIHTKLRAWVLATVVWVCPSVLSHRGVRGSLQQRFLFGSGEKLRPLAGHRRGRLQGQPVGCEQSQLHYGETPTLLPWSIDLSGTLIICLQVLFVCVCVLQSLTGHKNPVECVQFNSTEDQIVAGSQSGSIRVWDMEAAKSKSVCVCLFLFTWNDHTWS